ncbi:GH family lysozyme [Acrasis kona]|uniref:GH family lysozyme n=1 Tax=Acrasis kona TaxID=1008807 RepID=A0AAW2Z806_9EUKA
MQNKLILLALSVFVVYANATLGLDLSFWQGDVSLNTWKCLRGSGYQFAIVQVWKQSGEPNPWAVSDIKRAYAAGFLHVDAYIFPKTSISPEDQVKRSIDLLRSQGAGNFGMIWIDVESKAAWGNCDQNVAYLNRLINQIKNMGVKPGIYSSSSQWSAIMCGRGGFSNIPLWYAHYDNNPSFSDFRSFGGWSKPAIKQYKGDTKQCGINIDANFY